MICKSVRTLPRTKSSVPAKALPKAEMRVMSHVLPNCDTGMIAKVAEIESESGLLQRVAVAVRRQIGQSRGKSEPRTPARCPGPMRTRWQCTPGTGAWRTPCRVANSPGRFSGRRWKDRSASGSTRPASPSHYSNRNEKTPPNLTARDYRGGFCPVATRRQAEGVQPVTRRNSRLKLLFVLKPEASIASVTLASPCRAWQASRIR